MYVRLESLLVSKTLVSHVLLLIGAEHGFEVARGAKGTANQHGRFALPAAAQSTEQVTSSLVVSSRSLCWPLHALHQELSDLAVHCGESCGGKGLLVVW